MSNDLTIRLEALYSGIVHDVMRKMGQKNFTAPKEIRPIMPGKTLAGPVFTINGEADPKAQEHRCSESD